MRGLTPYMSMRCWKSCWKCPRNQSQAIGIENPLSNCPSHGSGTTTGGNDPDFKDLLRQSIHAWRGYERNSPCRSFGHAVGKMGPPLVTTLPGTLFPLALLIESEFFVDHEGAEGQQGGDECLHRATESDFSVEQGEQEAEA